MERFVVDIRVFTRAAVVGIVLQIALMVAVHFVAFIERQGFLLGGMTISAVAGYLYAMDTGKGYFTSATMAAILGGGSALIGVGVSVLLHDAPPHIVPLFTTICVVTGAIGGLFGQMSANIKKMGGRR
jgi:general stress protein CsbA